jgi:hypothetical protein
VPDLQPPVDGPDWNFLDRRPDGFVELDGPADKGLYLLPPHFLADRRYDTISWDSAVAEASAAREADDVAGLGVVADVARLSDARSMVPTLVARGSTHNWEQLIQPRGDPAGAEAEFHDNDTAAGGAVADGAAVDDGTAAGDGGTAAHSDGNEGGSD